MKLGKALATGVAQEQPEAYEEESPFAEESPEPVAREEAPAAAR
ncbi:hypothetical protein ABZ397_22185 [Streptomyces sp. NPDC005876]